MTLLKTVTGFVVALFVALPLHAEIDVQEVITPKGFKAWLIEDHSIPFTALELQFRGGTALDPSDQRGVTNLMVSLLEEGSGELDAQAFAAARDLEAAQFGFDAGLDSVSVSARFLTENRDESLALLERALNAPRFDADAVERVRAQVVAGIEADRQDPSALAAESFNQMAFGNHPYAFSGQGTRDSVLGLSRADLIAAHQAVFAQDRVFIAAAGDITATELGAVIDQLLGTLPAKGGLLPMRAPWQLEGGVTVVDYPSPQSLIRFGQQGIKRHDPDFMAAYMLNEILGGGRFSARLMTEVRDRRGLTYGIATSLLPRDQAELYLGQFSTANETVAEAIEVVRDEWRKMLEEGVSEAELEAIRTYLTGNYPLRFDGNGPIASLLVGMQMEGLGIDYIAKRNELVNAVTLEDLQRVAKRLLAPDALHFVVVGQPVGVTSSTK